MKNFSFNQDDPRLTAYALGELPPAERAEFEQWLRTQPEAQQAVDEIRATAGLLSHALADEESSAPPVRPIESSAFSAVQSAEQVDEYRRPRSQLLRFPTLYYAITGLAAACFAVIFFTQSENQRQQMAKRYIAMDDRMADQLRAAQAAAQARETAAPPPPAAAAAPTAMDPDETRPVVALETPERTSTLVAPPQVKLEAFKVDPPSRGVLADALGGKVQIEKIEPITVASYGAADKNFSSQTLGDTTWGSAKTKFASGRLMLARDRVHLDTLAVGRLQHEASNTEGYAASEENPFLTVVQNPLSTFSIDVDTAAYANVRRFLHQKRLPPKGAVRIEELVNYFPYRYTPPTDGAPFAAHLEVASAPWAPTHRLVRIGLKGREISEAARPRANLVFLVDVSGSMSAPNKLPLVQQSLRLLVEKLRADDRVAVVVYAAGTGMALPSTPVREKAKILEALAELEAAGSTNGGAGIQLAYDIAKANFVPGGVNRVVLATDGDFNVGVSSESELTDLIREKAQSGVFLSVLGFGMGNLKDSTLEKLADKGNGNYAYIDSLAEAKKTLVEQAGGTLVTIAKDVKLQVEFNPAQAQAYRLIGYENRMLRKEDFNNDKVDAGEIGAGHTVTALYEVIPVGASMPETGSVEALKYQRTLPGAESSKGAGGELLTLKVRYKEPSGDVSTKLEFPLRDTGTLFADASADFKFSAAVAAFGMRLKDSPYCAAAKFTDIVQWAHEGTAEDGGGYRAEFVQLAGEAAALTDN